MRENRDRGELILSEDVDADRNETRTVMAGTSRSDADSVMREIAFGVIEEERGERVRTANYVGGTRQRSQDMINVFLHY